MKNSKKEVLINWKKYIYEIIIPWWNPTALVEVEKNINLSSFQKKEINDKIMLENKEVEQVGFIYKDIKNPKLEMAWWEFCANAVRATIYKYFIDYKIKIKNISVSWTIKKLETFIEKKWEKYFSKTQMPIYSNPENIEKIDKNTYIVNMDWITHIVIEKENLDNLSKEEIKIKAMKKIEYFDKKYLKLKNISCLAVIYLENNWNKKEIKPVVFVRSINTSFYETACGSWTCAVWMVEALKKEKNIEMDILQPSWSVISTKIEYSWKKFQNAYICGVIN